MSAIVEHSPARSRFELLRARPWARVLIAYLISRVVSSAMLGAMFAVATRARWPFASVRTHPDFFTFSGSWDAWFYRSIAEHGYPATVPTDALGHVVPNPWAFLPVFPGLERGLMSVTGLSAYTAGSLIAAAAGGGAAIVLQRLLAPHVGEDRAVWAAVLFCFGPLAFLLQVAYAESLFLLLLFAALLLIQRGQYLGLIPVGLLAAFTRPGAIAVPGALAVVLALTWWRAGRRPPHLGRGIIAGLVIGVACLAWPVIADLATGRHGTYLDTELSWWTGWVGRPAFVPFTPWFLITSRWLGPVGVVLAVLLAVGFAVWIVRGGARVLGTTIVAFSAVYLLYLVAVFLPQFSLPRLLMPLSPLLGAAVFTGSGSSRRVWLAVAAAFQPVGVVLLWFLSYP